MTLGKSITALLLVLFVVAAFWLFEADKPAADVDAKYSNAASAFLTLADGTRIHYRDQGQPQGLPVVLLHGSNASLHTWEPWVAQLGDTYRLITLDLPGHGLTGRTPSEDYSTSAFIKAVKGVTAHLALDSFVLGGNSMGGGVTWRYALRYPEDVKALILVDASAPAQWRESPPNQTAQQPADTPLAFSLLRQPWFQAVATYLDPYYLVVQGLRSSHYNPAVVTESLIERYYDLSMRTGTRAATIKRFSGLREQTNSDEADLRLLTQPVLILWGEYDALIPVSTADRFAQVLPNAQVMIYPNVGHIPMEEVPELSAQDVRLFLQAL